MKTQSENTTTRRRKIDFKASKIHKIVGLIEKTVAKNKDFKDLEDANFLTIISRLTVLHEVKIGKLLTQHVVGGESWVPTNGSPPCWWWGYHSIICIHEWFEMGCHLSPSLNQ